MRIAPNDTSYKTFTELLTAYRISDILIVIGETGLMERIGDEGNTVEAVVAGLNWHPEAGRRFLECLCGLGLLERRENTLYRTAFSDTFFAPESGNYQGSALEFEKILIEKWSRLGASLRAGQGAFVEHKSPGQYQKALRQFIAAMDDAARIRSRELWESFRLPAETGIIVEVGAGSGAYLSSFLERYPRWRAIFCDLPDIIQLVKTSGSLTAHPGRVEFVSCNLLEEAPVLRRRLQGGADILLASNFLHCQGYEDTAAILGRILPLLKNEGLLIAHDFFASHNWQGALYDLHMFLNTYNGRTYAPADLEGLLKGFGLVATHMTELPSGSVAYFAARSPRNLPETDGTEAPREDSRRPEPMNELVSDAKKAENKRDRSQISYDINPIGVIRSELTRRDAAPRQGSEGAPEAWVEVDSGAVEGLEGIGAGTDIILITWFHRADRETLKVHPRRDRRRPLAGVFSTRSPDRPNPLGLHRVTVLEIIGSRLRVRPLEAIDGTPVVDIKPVLLSSPDS